MSEATTTVPRPTWADLDKFTQGYIECALWSSLDNADDSGGEPLDRNYSWGDLDGNALAIMVADSRAFQSDNRQDLNDCGLSFERQGHDFWLNRNGHGSGFWDEGHEPCYRRLSDASKVYGSQDLYVYETPDGEKIGVA